MCSRSQIMELYIIQSSPPYSYIILISGDIFNLRSSAERSETRSPSSPIPDLSLDTTFRVGYTA
jgi:hypothetical protein